jgi:hypothetical protein
MDGRRVIRALVPSRLLPNTGGRCVVTRLFTNVRNVCMCVFRACITRVLWML